MTTFFKHFLFLALLACLLPANVFGGGNIEKSNKKQPQMIHLTSYETGIWDEGAAEIVAYDRDTQKVFFVNADAGAINILDISDPASPVLSGEIIVENASINSVAVKNGLVAAAAEPNNYPSNGAIVLATTEGKILQSIEVGVLPDCVVFSPNGRFVVAACEGEPNDDYSIDPEGSVAIINTSNVKAGRPAELKLVTFTEDHLEGNVRIGGPTGTTVSQDLEPEYIAVSPDSVFAYVAFQENNAIGKIELATGKVEYVKSLGLKDHSIEGNGFDASSDDDGIQIKTWPVMGMYMPDTIAAFEIDGKTYIASANEGDGREYDGYEDEGKVGKVDLDETAFPNAKELQAEEALKSLRFSTADGDIDGDGDYDIIHSFGARSFSIWDDTGELIFDSGDDFEQIVADTFPKYFNVSNDSLEFEDRSPKKGPEPEALTIGKIDGRTYAFIGLERMGGIMMYDVTTPADAQFIQYLTSRNFDAHANEDGEYTDWTKAGDLAPEGMVFVPASDSPNGKELLIVGNEVSGTVSFYTVD